MKPANDNGIDADEVARRLDWVRPVATAMRASAIPEEVVNLAMADLLKRLDRYLDGPVWKRKLTC
jgi:hypothetical protein